MGESAAVRRRRSRVRIAPRRPRKRKAPLEWPATRFEHGWAPQGVAFEPSAFRQHGCGRSRSRPHRLTRGGAAARRVHNPEAAGASPAPATSTAQILKRQRGLIVDQVPSGFAGSSPALCTRLGGGHWAVRCRRFLSTAHCLQPIAFSPSVRRSMAEPCVAHAQTRVRFPSAAPPLLARSRHANPARHGSGSRKVLAPAPTAFRLGS
jgi:hypothetical protein